MIKRRFFKLDRGGRDSESSSSSPSSDDEEELEQSDEEENQQAAGGSEGEEEEEEQEEENDKGLQEEEAVRFKVIRDGSRSGSGYESEESSGNEITCDETAGLLFNDDEVDIGIDNEELGGKQHPLKEAKKKKQPKLDGLPQETSESELAKLDECVLKCKSVFKCRLCPRIVCLSEAIMELHLKSKRHARSKKLLKEGRLKLMLNSDGELEEEEETHAERHARTVALAQQIAQSKTASKKNKGRQRQRHRKKAKMQVSLTKKESEDDPLSTTQAKKKREVKD